MGIEDSMDLSEHQLIARFCRGEKRAFEEVIERWNHDVINLAYKMIGDREEAHDIAQQCFLKAYQGRERFAGEAKIGTWLYRITVNLCRDRIRANQVRRRFMHGAMEQARGEMTPKRDESREQQETIRKVSDAVATLPESEREVVVLRHYHGLTCPEISDVLDTPYSTVKSRLNQALGRLRQRLEEPNSGTMATGVAP